MSSKKVAKSTGTRYGITSIGVKNFKSLKKIAPLELKPMTILVGKNSCGKSSFLRILPLLKQSSEENIDGPLSLYGNYVDYGEFSDIPTTGKVTLRNFQFCVEGYFEHVRKLAFVKEKLPSFGKEKSVKYSMNLTFKKKNAGSIYVSDVSLTIGLDIRIKVAIDSNETVQSIVVNGKNFNERKLFAYYPRSSHYILPSIVENASDKPMAFWLQNTFIKLKKSEDGVIEFLNGTLDDFDLMSFQSSEVLSKYLEFIYNEKISQSLFSFSIDELKKKSDEIVYAMIPEIFSRINSAIYSTACSVRYSKPVRANAERYYRYKPLHVNEISPDGNNLAHVLMNLSDSDRVDLQQWLKENFGFTASVDGDSLMQIKIKKGDDEHNIVDMGFGFTQMLPIIVQLWISTKGNRLGTKSFEKNPIFAVEQPELHLHPSLQKILLRTFCNCLKISKGDKPRFILETHSKTFVMLLGELIEDGIISPNDVSILVFDNESGHETSVKESCFNDDGDLENWPIGFFN